MEIRQLRYFVAVAEDLHFKRAAKRLHISQPPLTRSIQQLEEELGAKLLNRTTRKVELTEAGKNFATEVRQILERLLHAAGLAAQVSRGFFGQIVVGYTPARANVVAQSVKLFTQRYPNIRVALRDISGQTLESIRDGRIDVGFVGLPLNTEGLIVEPILRERFIVAMAANHPLAERKVLSASDLASAPNLLFPRSFNPVGHDLIVGLCQRKSLRMNVVMEVETMPMRMELVKAGFGIAVIRESARAAADGIIFRSLKSSPVVELGVAYNRGKQSRALQLFLESVRAKFSTAKLK